MSPIITPVLTLLINKTFAEGEFSKSFKIVKIVPIFKGGDIENITNYRPISILSNFSKIFEKCMYKRLYDYLIANNLFSGQQFGFRKNKSTMQAVVNLVRPVYRFNIGLYMYKSLECVDYDVDLCNYVNGNLNRHVYPIRNADAITLPRYRCESSKCDITYVASKFWNDLPTEIKSSETVGKFKRSLRYWLSS